MFYCRFYGGAFRLHNIVEKSIRFETEYKFEDWRYKLAVVNGNLPFYHPQSAYVGQYQTLLDDMSQDYQLKYLNYHDCPSDSAYRDSIINILDNGTLFFMYTGHGGKITWDGAASLPDLILSLNNENKTPFCFSHACLAGKFDRGMYSMAEEIVSLTMLQSRLEGDLWNRY
ncbi:MAG: C25 family cysteine peptidase [Bacteroidales bacterium]|nr:C25 family cysteine peptidase [Bacteroidales bacterium]